MNRALRAMTAVASIAAGVLHWDIWANHGYRSAPVRELFVASAVLGVAAGLLALAGRLGALAAAIVNAGFLAAFTLSRVGEMPTLHGGWREAGLNPEGAAILGASTTLLLLIAEGVAVVCGLTAPLAGRERRGVPLPSEYARA